MADETAPEVTPAKLRYRDPFAVGEFRALFAAYSISLTGSVVSAVALTVLVYARTGSSLLASLTFALGFLPYLVSGALLSAVVDRMPLRQLLVGCDIAAGSIVAVMAVPGMPIGVLLALLVAVGTITGVSGGARNASLPQIVPAHAYVAGRSVFRIAAQSAQIVGNGAGGALLIVLSPRGAILVDAGSFLVSAGITRLGMRHRDRMVAIAGGPSLLSDSLSGMRAVLAYAPLRRLLLLGWLVPTFCVAPEALAAPYVSELGSRAALVGWWLVALPLGVVAGDLIGVWALPTRLQAKLVAPLAAAVFIPLLAFVATPRFVIAFPLLVLSGMGAMYALGFDALMRDAAPEPLFRRALAINTSGLMFFQGLGFAAAGALAELVSPGHAIAIAGVAGLVVVALLRPRRRSAAA